MRLIYGTPAERLGRKASGLTIAQDGAIYDSGVTGDANDCCPNEEHWTFKNSAT